MFSTVNETKTPSELVEWLRLWANGYEDGDALDDNDARQLAMAVERVCQIGNAAAMRAALEGIEGDCRILDRKDMWEEEGECYYDALRDIREKVSAALAAPARNCDRFATAEEAYAAWMPSVELDAICDWLFAPAKEGKEARRG